VKRKKTHEVDLFTGFKDEDSDNDYFVDTVEKRSKSIKRHEREIDYNNHFSDDEDNDEQMNVDTDNKLNK